MMQKRGCDRRVRESGPPRECPERRCIAERRRIQISEATLDEFEVLMTALGFRNNRSNNDKH